MKPESNTNPLSAQARRAQAAPSMHHMEAHAHVWKHVGSMQSDAQGKLLDRLNYILPIMGALAGDPKVTAQDVIKAVADAAGERKITASDAVDAISRMPPDQADLRLWLRHMYAINFSAAVHLNASQLPDLPPQIPGAPPSPLPGMPVGTKMPPRLMVPQRGIGR